MSWQPIDTAPDDRQVVVWCPDNTPDERLMMGDKSAGYWVIHIDGQVIHPTHWIDVPKYEEVK